MVRGPTKRRGYRLETGEGGALRTKRGCGWNWPTTCWWSDRSYRSSRGRSSLSTSIRGLRREPIVRTRQRSESRVTNLTVTNFLWNSQLFMRRRIGKTWGRGVNSCLSMMFNQHRADARFTLFCLSLRYTHLLHTRGLESLPSTLVWPLIDNYINVIRCSQGALSLGKTTHAGAMGQRERGGCNAHGDLLVGGFWRGCSRSSRLQTASSHKRFERFEFNAGSRRWQHNSPLTPVRDAALFALLDIAG